jgi:hypothetical protein
MNNILIAFIVMITAFELFAQPTTITYQGVLTDDMGRTLTGTRNIRFDVCSTATGVSSIWNETHSNVEINKGLFEVELGSVTQFNDLDFSQELWLEITVNGTTLTPRIEFNAVGYALESPNYGMNNFTGSCYLYDTKTGVRLTPDNAATNVDFVINPKGTGAILAQQPDGTTAGGNSRGDFAIDLQLKRFNVPEVASGHYSAILGGAANTSQGVASVVIGGAYNIASGPYSLASGNSSDATAAYSIAMGYRNIASGEYSTALGSQNSAGGFFSTAIGMQSTASGYVSTVMGGNLTATGRYSTAIGYSSDATSDYSIAIGRDAAASNEYAVAVGNNPIASGYAALAMGDYTTASGYISTALGNRTVAPSAWETVLGKHNILYTPVSTTNWIATDRLLVVGNGTADGSRSNALTILKNANTTIGGSLTINGNGTNTSVTFPTVRGTNGQVLQTDGSGNTIWSTPYTGLTNFTESNYTYNIKTGVKFTPNNTETDVDIVLQPKGYGGILAQQPDGTTAGGNNRGACSVDLQMSRYNAASQVASGDYSFIGGGACNTASGTNSFVGGGSYNIANGTYSFIAGGTQNQASAQACFVGGGTYNTASGMNSCVLGGSTNTASGQYSFAAGNSNEAQSYQETVIGPYATIGSGSPTSFVPTDRLFVVGNGTYLYPNATRSDALTILKNGNTTIGGSLTINSNGTSTSILFPVDRGTSGQVLQTDGSGNTSWANTLTNFTESSYGNGSTINYGSKFLAKKVGQSNVDFVIQPKGTGAILAQQPDGTATGGNKRGEYAVDFQMIRSASTNVASGDNSVICGGSLNTASGPSSTVIGGWYNSAIGGCSNIIGGYNNTANGDYSIALGKFANAYGDFSFAINLNSNNGPSVATQTFRISGASEIGGNVAWTNYSDKRLKKDIVYISDENNLDKIMSLNAVRFRWKANDELLNLGFIAQETENIIPESVRYDEINDIYSMEYTAIIPVLVEGMKEQKKMIDDQNAKIKNLQQEIDELKKELALSRNLNEAMLNKFVEISKKLEAMMDLKRAEK